MYTVSWARLYKAKEQSGDFRLLSVTTAGMCAAAILLASCPVAS